MSYRPDILIYHDNCDDGFAAAWVVHSKWGDDVTYVASNYGRPLPEMDVKGRDVLIADFSISPEQCEDIVTRGGRVLILDHHKTAEEKLGSSLHRVTRPTINNVERCFGRILVEFDMERSGARMTWDFVFPNEAVPELVLAVEDRDLWRFDRTDTKLVSLFLRSLRRDFTEWSAAASLYEYDRERFLEQAVAIRRFYDIRVGAICDSASLETMFGHPGVAVVRSCPYDFVSDTCHALLDRHSEAPFAVAVIQNGEGVSYSLRSRDDRVDVSEIAKARGGGGHRNAAGFRVDGFRVDPR